MGADMCIAYLVKNRKRKLNWKAGERAIKNLKYEKDENGVLVATACSGLDMKQETLIGYLANIEEACKGRRRDADIIEIGGNEVLFTGGMTWGDSPSDLYDAICQLDDMDGDILGSVGFHQDEDRKDWKTVVKKILKNRTLLPTLLGLDDDLDKMISKELKNSGGN